MLLLRLSSSDWKIANDKLSLLTDTIKQISGDVPLAPEVNTLTSRVSALRKDVAARDKLAAMTESNEITGLVADLSGHFQLIVPVQVVKLDYLGRKLQLESVQRDLSALKETASAIRGNWNEVKPKIQQKGAAGVAKRFDSVVASLEVAQGVVEFSRLAQKELEEVDNLEKVFTR